MFSMPWWKFFQNHLFIGTNPFHKEWYLRSKPIDFIAVKESFEVWSAVIFLVVHKPQEFRLIPPEGKRGSSTEQLPKASGLQMNDVGLCICVHCLITHTPYLAGAVSPSPWLLAFCKQYNWPKENKFLFWKPTFTEKGHFSF